MVARAVSAPAEVARRDVDGADLAAHVGLDLLAVGIGQKLVHNLLLLLNGLFGILEIQIGGVAEACLKDLVLQRLLSGLEGFGSSGGGGEVGNLVGELRLQLLGILVGVVEVFNGALAVGHVALVVGELRLRLALFHSLFGDLPLDLIGFCTAIHPQRTIHLNDSVFKSDVSVA